MRHKYRIALMAGLGALALPLFAASVAQADVPVPMKSDAYSCVFTGAAGPIGPGGGVGDAGDAGVESVAYDLLGDPANPEDPNGPLLDEDNGDETHATAGTPSAFDDGRYTFATAPLVAGTPPPAWCLYWSNPTGYLTPVPSYSPEVGITNVNIASTGTYDNIVCGTGRAYGQATVTPNGAFTGTAAPEGNPVTANVEIDFFAGQGELQVFNVSNGDDTHGYGQGYVNIAPTNTVNNVPAGGGVPSHPAPGVIPCVADLNGTGTGNGANVTQFQASGAFGVVIPEDPAST